MNQIGRAAAALGITVELCTVFPRHSLAALEMATVTSVRLDIPITSMYCFMAAILNFAQNRKEYICCKTNTHQSSVKLYLIYH